MMRFDGFGFIGHMASMLTGLHLAMAMLTCDCHVLRVIPLSSLLADRRLLLLRCSNVRFFANSAQIA